MPSLTENSMNSTISPNASNLNESDTVSLGSMEDNETEITATDSSTIVPESETSTVDTNTCPWFLCNNTRCVLDTWRCDLQDDCGDNSDEDSCDQSTCDELQQFRCSSGMCISKDWICDWIKDCPHGDDEDNC